MIDINGRQMMLKGLSEALSHAPYYNNNSGGYRLEVKMKSHVSCKILSEFILKHWDSLIEDLYREKVDEMIGAEKKALLDDAVSLIQDIGGVK
jgi:hypothetical protein